MSGHTPGEWKVFTMPGSFQAKRLYIMAKTHPDSEESEIVFDAGPADDEQAQANARLGATAKDFYEAGLDMKHNAGPLDTNAHAGDQGPVVIPWRVYAAMMAAVDKVAG